MGIISITTGFNLVQNIYIFQSVLDVWTSVLVAIVSARFILKVDSFSILYKSINLFPVDRHQVKQLVIFIINYSCECTAERYAVTELLLSFYWSACVYLSYYIWILINESAKYMQFQATYCLHLTLYTFHLELLLTVHSQYHLFRNPLTWSGPLSIYYVTMCFCRCFYSHFVIIYLIKSEPFKDSILKLPKP